MRRAPLLSFAAVLALAACAPAMVGPPPPPPPPGSGSLLPPDWRGSVTSADRDRLDRLDAAWDLALQQARSQEGSGDLSSLGRLIDPRAGRNDALPPPGDYRCRTVKLGSQSGADGLGYVVYGWFACRIEVVPTGLKFTKLTGSQRPSGLLFPESARRAVFLGSMALGNEPPASSYGRNDERDMVGVIERIDDARWRLVIPWPRFESNLDILELVPA